MAATANPNLKFYFGILLIVCGWVICFDVFMLIIGIPFFLIGALLVATSKKKLFVRLIIILLPIVLWFIGFALILHEIKKNQPQITQMQITQIEQIHSVKSV